MRVYLKFIHKYIHYFIRFWFRVNILQLKVLYPSKVNVFHPGFYVKSLWFFDNDSSFNKKIRIMSNESSGKAVVKLESTLKKNIYIPYIVREEKKLTFERLWIFLSLVISYIINIIYNTYNKSNSHWSCSRNSVR